MENLNLKDTWIDRTKEVDEYFQERYGLKNCTNGFYYYDEDGFHLGYFESQKVNKKQIHLVDGEFHYVEEEMSKEKIEDSFNKFGYEELKDPDIIIGYLYKDKYDCLRGHELNNNTEIVWNNRGKCLTHPDCDLTPLKVNWWEKEENIGKLCITKDTEELFFLKNSEIDYKCVYATVDFRKGNRADTNFCDVSLCRPLTKEECLSLCIKE